VYGLKRLTRQKGRTMFWIFLGVSTYAAVVTIAAVCLWFEYCYWVTEAERDQDEILRLEDVIGNLREESKRVA